ncbi:MAG: virulence-associated E family protein [Marinilabiliales bacterium]|nr:virulence-associated E family protein [Marinilabiliales bacterium]
MRRKYDRRISTIKRRCSFAGSGNNLFVVGEQQNRRIIPLEIEKMHFEKLAAIDYTDLFMEAYNLLVTMVFHTQHQQDNKQELRHLYYSDYIQYSDVDLIFDEYVQKPDNVWRYFFLITNLDLVNALLGRFPHASKRINVLVIGKLMAENGFDYHKRKRRKACNTLLLYQQVQPHCTVRRR